MLSPVAFVIRSQTEAIDFEVLPIVQLEKRIQQMGQSVVGNVI